MSTYVGTVKGGASRFLEPKSIGILGILLGLLALWLAIPPIEASSPVWPALAGLLGAMCGVIAVSRGAYRVGGGAIASSLFGAGLAYLATRSAPRTSTRSSTPA